MVSVAVHRGTDAIGGSCIEISADSGRLILDLGMPLMADGGGELDAGAVACPSVENGILPDIPDLFDNNGDKPVLGVVISHAHPDHFGLLGHVRKDVPVFMSKESLAMIGTGNIFLPKDMRLPGIASRCQTFRHGRRFMVSGFAITPFLVDHSAFGASALLVEIEGKRIFYTGDIRLHGRKQKATRAFVARIGRVDCMLMEGTTLGGRHKTKFDSEEAVEQGFMAAFSRNNASLVLAAGSNIDRTVSLYRACKKRGKQLVIDLYQYTLLSRLRAFASGLPPHEGDHLRVFFERRQEKRLIEAGMEGVLREARSREIKAGEIIRHAPCITLRLSWPMMDKIVRKLPRDGLSFIYSMWDGYLKRDESMRNFPQTHGGQWQHVHTSGHAWAKDLQWLTQKIRPAMLIPVHTLHGDDFPRYFDNVHRVTDGEEVIVVNENIIKARLENMTKWAKERREGMEKEKMEKEKGQVPEISYYIRVGGNGFRAVSVAASSPLSGFYRRGTNALGPAKRWEIAVKHAKGNPREIDKKVEEKRLQAFIIRCALGQDGELGFLDGCEFKKPAPSQETVRFDKVLLAFDEISLGDSNHPVSFFSEYDGNKQGVIRCDLLCVGVRGNKGYPILIELKYARRLKELIEQLDEFACQIAERYEKEFSELLKAATGLEDIDCSSVYKAMIWPAPAGCEHKNTKKKLGESHITVFEYKAMGEKFLESAEIKQTHPPQKT